MDKKTKNLLESKDQLDTICKYLNQIIISVEKKTKSTEYIKCHETEKNNFSLIATKRRSLLLKNALPNKIIELEYISLS